MAKLFQVYGIGQALIPVLPPPVPFASAPSNQTNFSIGQLAYSPSSSPTAFYLYAGGGNWFQIPSGSSSGGLTWNNNAVSGAALANNGYIITSVAQQTFTLPSVSSVGDQLSFVLNGTGQWRVASNGSLSFGGVPAANFIQSNIANRGVSLTLVCVVANSGWASLSYTGGVTAT